MIGIYEFVKKDDPPVIGLRKLTVDYAKELVNSKMKLPYKLQKLREMQQRGEEVPWEAAIEKHKETSMTPGKIIPV